VSKVEPNDDFFDLGGTSLALINVVVEMSKRFNLPLDTGIVTQGATVSALAKAVKEKMSAANLQQPTVEQVVAEIWASALGVGKVGSNDDFFELGGTSLALINVVTEMGKRFGLPLDTSIMTRGATVSALAQAVKERISAATRQEPSVEQAVAEIWASTLGISKVGPSDDFFDLGGTSLALINVVMEMSKRFGVPLETSIVTGGATVSALAQAVKEKRFAANEQEPPVEQVVAEMWASMW
jgi:acyl carrier protein